MILINISRKGWLYISLIIVCLLIGAAIIYGYFIYHGLMDQKKAGFAESTEKVLADTSLNEIDAKYKYFGEDNYHIYFGSTEDQEEKVVFFPLDEENEITTLDQSDIISKEDVKEQWKKECESCKLMKVRPAMDEETPLWELTYKDTTGRLVLDYVSFKDGSDYEAYRFKQTFQ